MPFTSARLCRTHNLNPRETNKRLGFFFVFLLLQSLKELWFCNNAVNVCVNDSDLTTFHYNANGLDLLAAVNSGKVPSVLFIKTFVIFRTDIVLPYEK